MTCVIEFIPTICCQNCVPNPMKVRLPYFLLKSNSQYYGCLISCSNRTFSQISANSDRT